MYALDYIPTVPIYHIAQIECRKDTNLLFGFFVGIDSSLSFLSSHH